MKVRNRKEVEGGRLQFTALLLGIMLATLFCGTTAQAAFPTPLYDQTVINVGDLRIGDKVCGIGMSNMKQVGDKINFPGITYVNAAEGGATMREWSATDIDENPTFSGWGNVPNDCDIFLINTASAPVSIPGARIRCRQ